MKVCVIGLGRVGLIASVCLAKLGHTVQGVDIDRTKTRNLQEGMVSINEPSVENILCEVLANGHFRAATDLISAVGNSEISLICVDTPNDRRGSPRLTSIRCACSRLGKALGRIPNHQVAIKSTVLPGTTEKVIIPLLERFSGKKEGTDFDVSVNPEFLREGTAVYDFFHPTRLIIGSKHVDRANKVSELYKGIDAETIVTEIRTAEMIKYVDNAFHGLKIAFANEIARICGATDIDASEVMRIFSKDTKLNISTAYLRPGLAFGGSCIPKDLKALNSLARREEADAPLLRSILESNDAHIARALELILRTGKDKIGIFGVSFKKGTDDIRESALLKLASSLLRQDKRVRIYDINLNLETIRGANEEYLRKLIPNPRQVVASSSSDVVNFADVIVIGHDEDTYIKMATRDPTKTIVDLTGTLNSSEHVNYCSLFCRVSSREKVDDRLERERIFRARYSNGRKEITKGA